MKSGKFAATPLLLLAALTLLAPLSGCQTFKGRSTPTNVPQVACEERAPSEPAPVVDATSEDWRHWYRAFLEAMGVATAEAQKRATTAECLDALRAKGVIR